MRWGWRALVFPVDSTNSGMRVPAHIRRCVRFAALHPRSVQARFASSSSANGAGAHAGPRQQLTMTAHTQQPQQQQKGAFDIRVTFGNSNAIFIIWQQRLPCKLVCVRVGAWGWGWGCNKRAHALCSHHFWTRHQHMR